MTVGQIKLLILLFYIAASNPFHDVMWCRCPVSHIEKFKSGEFNMCAPSASYQTVLSRGLTEELGFSEDEAHGYLGSAFLPKIK